MDLLCQMYLITRRCKDKVLLNVSSSFTFLIVVTPRWRNISLRGETTKTTLADIQGRRSRLERVLVEITFKTIEK